MSRLNKFLLIILVILGISWPISYYFNILVEFNGNKNETLTKIPYANQTIDFGVQVTAGMISYMNVPKSILNGDYYLMIEDIVGRCVRDDTRIGEGSIFYKEFLTECEDDDLEK